jgi:hypothetical protein
MHMRLCVYCLTAVLDGVGVGGVAKGRQVRDGSTCARESMGGGIGL